MSDEDLEEYQSKRETGSTPEPSAGKPTSDGSRSVIQKHASPSLHYGFRLEVEGVLESWAVPKGPSTDPAQKPPAVPTEDHPVDYLEAEGVIPTDGYGAGTVLVWDTGDYESRMTDDQGNEISVSDAYESGHISVDLHDQKVGGGYALTRTGSSEDARWLLVKVDDVLADARRNPTSTEPESVLTGRTIEEIAAEKGSDG